MRIFVSWSGDRSKSVASALKTWLSDVFPNLEVWMSAHDIHAGDPWTNSLHQRLRDADFGILCLTETNLAAPWLLYEAGALVMTVQPGRVVPYLIDVDPALVKQPLSQLQGVSTDRDGTFRLIQAVNEANDPKLTEDRLMKTFEKWWPDLDGSLGMPMEASIISDVAVVAPRSPRLLGEETERLKRTLLQVMDRGVWKIVIDCSEIEQMSSDFLATLAYVMKRVRSNGGDIALAAMKPPVREVMAITKYEKIIACCADVEEAIGRVSRLT